MSLLLAELYNIGSIKQSKLAILIEHLYVAHNSHTSITDSASKYEKRITPGTLWLLESSVDKYKRALADSENLRIRLTKQIEDAKLFGIQAFCKDLLEVADILSKATESVPKEEVQESNPHLKSLYEGLTMTEAQLQNFGVHISNKLPSTVIQMTGCDVCQQEVQGKQPGTVVVVSKVGYKLHERVVRPALVGVAKT
uniref:GrpE protein homolog n=1 Tax=Timema poppense TaxID=170557 RepID=A0A7R9D6S8_TIMPO|nr:unnamed protein product [Timema poppensis]